MRANKLKVIKRLYSIKDTCAYLGAGIDVVRELINEGILPYIRIGKGGKLYIDIQDIDKYIDKQKKTLCTPADLQMAI
jgi:excisionase family DNA binding protein